MKFDSVMKRAAIGATVDLALRKIVDDPRRSMKNAVDLFSYMTEDLFGESTMSKIRREAENPRSCFYRMITSMVQNVDHFILKTVGTNMCYNRIAILSEPERVAVEKQPKGSLPFSPGRLSEKVKSAKEAGIYFFVLCGYRPLRFRERILDICRKNRDCVFYIAADGNDINENLAGEIAKAGNIILSVRINTRIEPEKMVAECSRFFQILKKQKCLFGYIAEIGSSSAKSCCSDGFINCMAKYGCLFGWYYAAEQGGQNSACRLAVNRLMKYSLTSRSKPLLLLSSDNDRMILNRFVTGGRCYLIFSDKAVKRHCQTPKTRWC
ncbi:hypothetical protein CAFE_13780 [Caprobacter fermentans]|uniref:Uncharacterized protein n=1 Tax=Caproicibacter fermentans TaxID=2576756 RepID=A0A6N8HY45_9FIRM|nr:hypothetical protein [Caproicibacter fermentans]MVB10682.1 hypothetical protein [Caproicibacter fermentans]